MRPLTTIPLPTLLPTLFLQSILTRDLFMLTLPLHTTNKARQSALAGMAILIAAFSSASVLANDSAASARTKASTSTVAIDIGHFPEPPELAGAKGDSGVYEYVYNKNLATKVGALLEAKNIAVIYTEGKLNDRAIKAKEGGAQLFVSIHHDSVPEYRLEETKVPGNRYRGYSLFVSQKNAQYRGSLACASKIGSELLKVRPRSLYHADDMPGARKAFLDEKYGVHRYDNLIVLKQAKMPAVLVEAGVIVNPEDEQAVTGKVEVVAAAIADGVRACLL
jgi:N-acetylmuramoyl-L-alanine amidase